MTGYAEHPRRDSRPGEVLIVGFILLIVMINLILIFLQALLTGKGHLLLEL